MFEQEKSRRLSKPESLRYLLSPNLVSSASASYVQTVRDNHGVRRRNLETLLYPLGIVEPRLDSTWLAQMDSFGATRGNYAHKSIKALNPPDPQSELADVNYLLQGLLKLDRVVCALR